MRIAGAALLLLVLAGVSVAQDTNFSAGPQYLISYGSPLTLHSIATPSLSLGEAQPFVMDAGIAEVLGSTVPPASAPSETFLGNVYWGEHKDSQIVGRRLETQSVTPSETAAYMNAVASQVAHTLTALPEEAAPTSAAIIIELTGGSVPADLPASIFDAGVTGLTDAQALVARGYGIPLGDVAAYWKFHKRPAPRVFTNAEVVRPRQ